MICMRSAMLRVCCYMCIRSDLRLSRLHDDDSSGGSGKANRIDDESEGTDEMRIRGFDDDTRMRKRHADVRAVDRDHQMLRCDVQREELT